MKTKRIQVFEHAILYFGEVYNDVKFEKHHYIALSKLNILHNDKYFETRHNGIRFKQFVGVIQVDGLTIEILPKIDNYKEDEKITVAGKNYSGFDKRFLEKLEGWNTINFSHRVIDPSILYMDWDNDESLPNLDECLKRANINKTVSHNALDDAMDIVNLLRVYRGSR